MTARDGTRTESLSELYRPLLEGVPDALMTTDPLGIITGINKQMCEMTGYPGEALIGTPFNRYHFFRAPSVAYVLDG